MEPDKTTPPAFYFTVQFPDEVIKAEETPDIVFREISGIGTEFTAETIEDGDLNSYVHVVPKSLKHVNLVLKSGMIARESILAEWCIKTLQGDLFTRIERKTILVELMNDQDDVLIIWRFKDAYPATWVVDEFNSTKDTILVESIEFAYSLFRREK
jgi:phage tail-like protein